MLIGLSQVRALLREPFSIVAVFVPGLSEAVKQAPCACKSRFRRADIGDLKPCPYGSAARADAALSDPMHGPVTAKAIDQVPDRGQAPTTA